jgi:hypothetical protein
VQFHDQRISHFVAYTRGLGLGLGDLRPDHGQAIGREDSPGIRFRHKSLCRRTGDQLAGCFLIEYHVPGRLRWNFHEHFEIARIFGHI